MNESLAVTTKPSLNGALQNQSKQIEALHAEISQLTAALNPLTVGSPLSSTPRSDNPRPEPTLYHEQVHQNTAKLVDAQKRLQELRLSLAI